MRKLCGTILAAGMAALLAHGNPVFDGWYADPQIRIYGDTYWVFPTTSTRFDEQTSFDAFSSRDMKTWTKHPRILTTNEVSWAKGAMWRDFTPKGYVEGSVLFERKGRWYFMYSSGSWTGDDYCINYSVADSPFGPFEFRGNVLGVQRQIATGAGHHSVVCIPETDDWRICYHRRPIPSEGRDHRVVCIDKMEFDPDGDIKPVVMTSSGKQEL